MSAVTRECFAYTVKYRIVTTFSNEALGAPRSAALAARTPRSLESKAPIVHTSQHTTIAMRVAWLFPFVIAATSQPLGLQAGLPTDEAATSSGPSTPLWATQFGPSSATGVAVFPAPRSGTPGWLNSTATWPSTYTPVASLLLSSSGALLLLLQSTSSTFSLAQLPGAGDPTWVVLLAPPLPLDYGCSPSSMVQDDCGAVFVSLSCGPEPLSTNNYLFGLTTATGAVFLNTSVFDTGWFSALAASPDCTTLATTSGAKGSPSGVVLVNATSGGVLATLPGSSYNLRNPIFSLAYAADGSIAGCNNPAWPYCVGYGAGGASPWSASDPGGGRAYYSSLLVPAVRLVGGGTITAVDPVVSAPTPVVTVLQLSPAGDRVWVAPVSSCANATTVGLGLATSAGVVIVVWECPGAVVTGGVGGAPAVIAALSLADGSVLSSCSVTAGSGTTTTLRGLALDPTGVTATAVLAGYIPSPGSPWAQGTMTGAELVTVDFHAGVFTVVRRAPLSDGPGLPSGGWVAPWWGGAMRGLTGPPSWPQVALRREGAIVLLPGVGVLTA